MKKIFVIGNIGSGKSSFSKLLCDAILESNKRCSYLDLDSVGHDAYNNTEIILKLEQVFGKGFTKDTIASVVFNNPDSLKKLTDIVQPYIYDKMLEKINNDIYDYIIVEESAYSGDKDKFAKHADILICVYANNDIRRLRWINKGYTSTSFENRNNAQLNYDIMMKNSDIVIDNNKGFSQLKQHAYSLIERL